MDKIKLNRNSFKLKNNSLTIDLYLIKLMLVKPKRVSIKQKIIELHNREQTIIVIMEVGQMSQLKINKI